MQHGCSLTEALENLLNGTFKGVIFSNDVVINNFNWREKTWHIVHHTRDIIRPVTSVFYFRRNSILTWMFDRKIEICIESGLTNHWISKYKQKPKNSKYRKPSKLKLNHIIAAIQISVVMYSIAFIVFLLEVFCTTHTFIKDILDYLTY